jgi:hypothetical protein
MVQVKNKTNEENICIAYVRHMKKTQERHGLCMINVCPLYVLCMLQVCPMCAINIAVNEKKGEKNGKQR